MAAADVNKHTRGHWESRTRTTTSATPYTGKSTARHGQQKARTPSPHSGTSHLDYSA